LTRHRAQINQQTIHFRHPYERIAANEAGKRPLRVKRPGKLGERDRLRFGPSTIGRGDRTAKQASRASGSGQSSRNSIENTEYLVREPIRQGGTWYCFPRPTPKRFCLGPVPESPSEPMQP